MSIIVQCDVSHSGGLVSAAYVRVSLTDSAGTALSHAGVITDSQSFTIAPGNFNLVLIGTYSDAAATTPLDLAGLGVLIETIQDGREINADQGGFTFNPINKTDGLDTIFKFAVFKASVGATGIDPTAAIVLTGGTPFKPTQKTTLANGKWTPFWGWYDGGDELGSYAASCPNWAVIDGEPYITSAFGAFNPYGSRNYGYRPELNGIFKIKADHTLERVITFDPTVYSVWSVCNHEPATAAVYGVKGLGWDYDQWVAKGIGEHGAPINQVASGFIYTTCRSVKGELVFYEGDAGTVLFVQNDRSARYCLEGDFTIRGFDPATISRNGLYALGQFMSFSQVAVDTAGKVWVCFENTHADKYYICEYPDLQVGSSPTKTYAVDRGAGRSSGFTSGSVAYLEDPDDAWVIVSGGSGFAVADVVITKIKKSDGTQIEEFRSADPSLTQKEVQPSLFRWQGKLYTDAYYSRIGERATDGTWSFEEDTPQFDGQNPVGINRAGYPPSPLSFDNFDFLRICATTDTTIYALCADEAYVGRGGVPETFDPNKKITQGILGHVVTNGQQSNDLEVYLAYIEVVAEGDIVEGPGDGPYQPPIKAKPGPSSGDLAFRRST